MLQLCNQFLQILPEVYMEQGKDKKFLPLHNAINTGKLEEWEAVKCEKNNQKEIPLNC